jgi:uncharacterized protein (DUF433 family)
MDWKDHITSDKGILGGKPIIKGTRLSVEFLLGLMSEGWTQERILNNYPNLTSADLLALFSYAQQNINEVTTLDLKSLV